MTEVHHINGKGEDAGVVYSEMQEYESEMNNIVSWKRKELFYPECKFFFIEISHGSVQLLPFLHRDTSCLESLHDVLLQ